MISQSVRNLFLLILCTGAFSLTALSQKSQNLRIGVAGSEPFVSDSGGTSGISVEVWKSISESLNLTDTAILFSGVSEGLQAIQDGRIDVLVGPISITSARAERVKFTQPYFQSSLSILSRTDEPSIWARISPFFSKKFFFAVCIFIFILGIVGTLLWLAERKRNSGQFPTKPGRGIPNGMWCAIVTMSTTGYGDIAPLTFWGRFIAGTWMVVSIIAATTMVAGIASTLTLSGLQSTTIGTAEQMRGKSIGVVKDSPAEGFAQQYQAKTIDIKDMESGYELLKDKKIDAILYDRPQLQFFMQEHHDEKIAVSLAEYERQGYGFALPMNTKLQPKLNIALLELKESGDIDSIVKNWLGDPDK